MNISERTAIRFLTDSKFYLRQGQFSKALDTINNSINYAKWADSFSVRASIYLKLGKLEEAIKDFKRSINMSQRHLEGGHGNAQSVDDYIHSLISLAGILYDKKNYKEAKEYIEKAQLAILSYDSYKGQTKAQILQNQIEAAIKKDQDKEKPKVVRPKSTERTAAGHRTQASLKARPRQISVHGSSIARSTIAQGMAIVKQPVMKEEKKQVKKSVSRITEFVFDPLLSKDNSPDTYRISDIYFGKTGLQNLGNTCYMNSTIQAIAAIPEIKNYFLNNIETHHLMEQNDYDLLSGEEIKQISQKLAKKNSTITEDDIDSQLDRSMTHEQLAKLNNDYNIAEPSQTTKESANDEKSEESKVKPEQNKVEPEEKKVSLPLGSLIKHKNGIFTSCFAEIIRELWISKSVSLVPDTLYQILAEIVPHFQNYTQQDAAQCLTYMLQVLHNELNVSIAAKLEGTLKSLLDKYQSPSSQQEIWQQYWLNNQSIVTYLFTGMAQYTIKCKECGMTQKQPQFFNMLELELPGNQEYKVRFVPLSEKLRSSVHPYSFQIQLREKEFLDRKTILEKSMRILNDEKGWTDLDQHNLEIFEEIAIKNYEALKQFDENKGLNDETNTLVIFEHPRFDPLYKDQVEHVPVLFELDSYYSVSYREWIMFPIERTKSFKDIVTIIRTYESRRMKKKQLMRSYGRSSFYNSPSSLLDIKIYDNLPPDPTYSKWSVKCGFCNTQHYAFKHCEPRCSNEMMLSEMFQLAGKRDLKFVALFKSYTSREEI